MSAEPVPPVYKPHIPPKCDYGIAVVGAGLIARAAHLPAYRKAGFRVVGIYDVDIAKAKALAHEYGLTVFPSFDAVLGSPAV